MKKVIFLLLFAISSLPGISQGWAYISGTVTDSANGYPVIGHPVTILSDSTFGFFYYNVVFTDSTGGYYDAIPINWDSAAVFYVLTHDCNSNVHMATFYYTPDNNTFQHDFQVCTEIFICQAWFIFSPEPPEATSTFRFLDQSIGNISSWFWDFGDNNFSQEQHPLHTYAGPGTYEVCLTINGPNCSDTYCNVITISDTVYHQIYGQVFAGNFPLRQGKVVIHAMNPSGDFYPMGESFQVDSNGIYFFTLVPEGQYLIQAFPDDSTSYVPTYYGDVISWQNALLVNLGEPINPYNINLAVTAGNNALGGPGSVMGHITTAMVPRSSVDDIVMFLLDESYVPMSFASVSASGEFNFPALDYGIYLLKAELAGIQADFLRIELTPEKPFQEIFLNFTGSSILGMDEADSETMPVRVYPNPVSEELRISVGDNETGGFTISICDMTGQQVYMGKRRQTIDRMEVSVAFDRFQDGLYLVRIVMDNGFQVVKKVIKD